MAGQANLGFSSGSSTEKDIFLCYNGADKPWVEMLALESAYLPYNPAYLEIVGKSLAVCARLLGALSCFGHRGA